MKIANIVKESLRIFWTTCEISMKLSGMMWLMIILKVKKLKVTKKQEFTISLADSLKKKTTGGVKLSPSLLRIKDISISLWLISTRDLNCIYLQNVKPVTFTYINIVQGNNFPKQYHALNTVFRLLDSYAEISNIFQKINYDGQNFQTFTQILIGGQSFQVFN